MAVTNRLFAQSAEMGALPVLYAATTGELPGGSFIGPDGRGEMGGYPTILAPSAAAREEAVAGGPWTIFEEPTGVHHDLP